jgi:hypothetical protein
MSTTRRLLKDEAGMTLGLAMMMILLLSVMGAGLLTFVSRDLNTVLENNRAQRAFEVADAGIEVAKRQLASSVVRDHYDDDGATIVGAEDIQWSVAKGGLTLNDLDGDGDPKDSVNVTIEYIAEGEDPDFPEEHFLVISTGTYGEAKRKIEAIFEGAVASFEDEDENIGHPLYYTPSSISIDGPNVSVDTISMFSAKDILIEGLTDMNSFVTEYDTNGGTLAGFGGKQDALCDWDSEDPLKGAQAPQSGCFVNSAGPYNDQERTITKITGPPTNPNTKIDPFTTPGFGAEGEICGFPNNDTSLATPPGTCTSASVADGIRGYDCTTGPVDLPDDVCPNAPQSRGNHLTFVRKDCDPVCPPNADDTISYPFPILNPIAEAFKTSAVSSSSYFEGIPSDPDWGLDTNTASSNRIAFVDAQNQTLTFDPSNGNEFYTGVIVVWCGRLEMRQNFDGIILNLVPEDAQDLPDNTRCDSSTPTQETDDGSLTVGTFETHSLDPQGQTCKCWVYAEGGTDTLAGIQIGPGSKVQHRPGEEWSFQDGFFEGPPPTSFDLKNWRELYE